MAAREYAPGRHVTPGILLRHRQTEWVVGYLSGVGAVDVAGYDPLNGMDAEGVFAWIDNYCRAHPLDKIEKAAATFVAAHPR